MRILLLYQYWHTPDHGAACRYFHLTDYLSEANEIRVVSSNSYFKDRVSNHFPDKPEKVRLHLSKVPYANKMGLVMRLFSYSIFSLKVLWRSLVGKTDVIWAVSTPLSVPASASILSKFKGVPWVFEVSDLWPDFPIEMGAIRNPLFKKMLYKLELSLYRSADHIVSKSPDITSHIVNLGIDPSKVTTTYNGTDFGVYDHLDYTKDVDDFIQDHGLDEKRIVIYAGTFGRANDIENLINATKIFANSPDTHFVYAGWGYHETDLRELMESQDNVTLIGLQSRPHTIEWLRKADLSLVSFKDLEVLKANSPTKFYDSLGVGTPVIVTNAGWTKEFVEQHECGWFVPPGQPRLLSEQIITALEDRETLEEFSDNAVTISRQLFDRKKLTPIFQSIFDSVTKSQK